ncbi:MAG: hypothetical protein QW304_06175 [Thermoproteota archaeon]
MERGRVLRSVAVEWEEGKPEGCVEVVDGELEGLRIVRGQGSVAGGRFAFTSNGPCRLEIILKECCVNLGSGATIVTVRTAMNPFSFFLRDVCKEYPIFIPSYGVIVTEADDNRSYEQVEETIGVLGLQTKLKRIQSEDEGSYEEAAASMLDLRCPTWLGLSRDMRVFEVDFRGARLNGFWIQPMFHSRPVTLPESNNASTVYQFFVSRGIGCTKNVTRLLEEGMLPILHVTVSDEDVNYHITAFVTLERSRLTLENLRGTHFLVADGHADGHVFTEEQERQFQTLLLQEMKQDEETVLFVRVEAVNSAPAPRYAWFKSVFPTSSQPLKWFFDGDTGFGVYDTGRVFCVSKINGKPMPQEELAVLLKPKGKAIFDFYVPHRPISRERAEQLASQDFEARHIECRGFWKQKLETGAEIKLPEGRVEKMVKAGLLHLDIVTYGLEPEGTVAPTIGIYSPIGSESAPIIQFMDSMGWHNLAKRALMYFLDKQHEDGFMQNFDEYMLETGAVLWSIGEHYRYTRDDAWLKQITSKLLKSCEYIVNWRLRNKREELRGKGYGMIDGKVADPPDPYHQFMLNGYAYLGLSRVAEILCKLDPVQAERLLHEAEELKRDIRKALFDAMAKSPVVPLGDGTWCPSAPPWAEARGPLSLYVERGRWFSHLTFFCRDSLLGPLHLIFQEVIDPNEEAADMLLNYHTELMYTNNVAFSQPYYSPHPWVHLRRGEVKAFLKTYYNSFVSLADRETFTFWEHYPGVGSPHKTHEEGWFLMQTRWMLWMEQGQTLKLLPGIPRKWMENGKSIELNGVASYFGSISLRADSKLDQGKIEARVECSSERQPRIVELRLPHPHGKKATGVKGGVYDAQTETVRIEPFKDKAEVELSFE